MKASLNPSVRTYLRSGLGQPGGKLPVHKPDGERFHRDVIEYCRLAGYIEPWRPNPIDPNRHPWKLTQAGRDAVGA